VTSLIFCFRNVLVLAEVCASACFAGLRSDSALPSEPTITQRLHSGRLSSPLFWLALLVVTCWSVTAQAQASLSSPADIVSPNIGSIGLLLTSTLPYVQEPYGMERVAPLMRPGMNERYLSDAIFGFPAGAGSLMISTGTNEVTPEDSASDFDHDFETARPYMYQVKLLSSGIDAEATATRRVALYRFHVPVNAATHLTFRIGEEAKFTNVSDRAIAGSERIHGSVGPLANADSLAREYFYAEFSRPLGNAVATESVAPHPGNLTVVLHCDAKTVSTLEVRIGISYISIEQAKRNLEEETANHSFDEIVAQTRQDWETNLGKIKVEGGTTKQRTIFYTALWRSLGRMSNITEDGHYYSGYDHHVHATNGSDFYVEDGLWDTFRSMHPLQLLLDGHRQEAMVRSYLEMYQQSGWLPSFPSVAGEQAVMIGHHAAQMILDTYAKGYRDFDLQLAYEAIRKNAVSATMLPWRRGPLTSLDKTYFKKGFFPALAKGEQETNPDVTVERRQAVSVTLENAYDDWAVAQMARALGNTKDAEYFMHLARNYENVFNPTIGFMAPRSVDGAWVADFDPKLGGGQGGRDYTTEMDSWVYTFSVQYDVEGLIRLMGGRDAFNRRLDHLFVEPYGTSKYAFLAQFPDATGLVGLYAQGNEPSFHIPYLYDFSGQPWKTQRRVRQLMDVWYGDGPRGIPGDDDGGETSSWYVFSALGFYPVCPGSPVYEIGSPIFTKSTITLGNGKIFTVRAIGSSAQNKYIQSARLNGKQLRRAWFAYADIKNGGTLELIMSPTPNLMWGARAEDVPPSMTVIESPGHNTANMQ